MKGLYARNMHVKLVSFLLTLLLYFFVISDKQSTTEYEVTPRPLLPERHVLLNELPTLDVTLRGTGRAFARLDEEAFKTVDLRLREGQTMYRVSAADFSSPEGIEVTRIVPEWIPLQMERLETHSVEIRQNLRGEPAPGYEISDVRVEPSQAEVTAPARYFENMSAVFTEIIDISGIRSSQTYRVQLSSQRPFVTYALPGDTVSVRVEVEARIGTRELDSVNVVVFGPTGRYEALDQAIRVRLRGPETMLEQLSAGDVYGAINPSTVDNIGGPGVYRAQPEIMSLPDSVTVEEITPSTIRLRVLEPEPANPDDSAPEDEEPDDAQTDEEQQEGP